MIQGSASADGPRNCSPDTMYGLLANHVSQRTQMQHKCVEMSLHITTGLAAGAFAMMFSELSKASGISAFDSALAKGWLVVAIDLYAILQLLILANYLYNTYMILVLDTLSKPLNQANINAIDNSLLQRIPFPTSSQEKDVYILKRLQPLIIYFSALIGGVSCVLGACWLFFPPVCSRLRWLSMIIPIFSFCLL